MRKFNSVGAFAEHLTALAGKVELAMHAELEKIGKTLEKDAKGIIGQYQNENMGPFPNWKPLAEATVEDRIRKGYAPDEPLLRTGDLRDSIESEADGLSVTVGSDSKIGLYQEMGTSRGIPPRPFLSLALVRNEAKIKERLGGAIMYRVFGQKLSAGE
jgi:phage gpG-like protein